MNQNDARKKKIRERMARTGEKYTTAMRALERSASTSPAGAARPNVVTNGTATVDGELDWFCEETIHTGNDWPRSSWAMAMESEAIQLAATESDVALGPLLMTQDPHPIKAERTALDLWTALKRSTAGIMIVDCHGTPDSVGRMKWGEIAEWIEKEGAGTLSCRMLLLGACYTGQALDQICRVVEPGTVVVSTKDMAYMASDAVGEAVANTYASSQMKETRLQFQRRFFNKGEPPKFGKLPPPIAGEPKPSTWPEAAWIAYWTVRAARVGSVVNDGWNPQRAAAHFNDACCSVDGFRAFIACAGVPTT